MELGLPLKGFTNNGWTGMGIEPNYKGLSRNKIQLKGLNGTLRLVDKQND